VPGSGRLAGLVPLFYLVPGSSDWWVFTQMCYSAGELLFVRLPGGPLTGVPEEVTVCRWLSELRARRRRYAAVLGNHQCWFVKHRPEEEIEHKFTLDEEVNVWRLAADLLADLVSGRWPGWIGEYRNEFEQWDFVNHLFQIAEPAAERGYVSFIPAVDGTWIVKRKWFDGDRPVRRERRWRGVVLGDRPDLPGEIVARFGCVAAGGASFRRVRYDVNVESLASGHGYSVMFDRCTALGSGAVLQQCEVEYLRSRTLLGVDDGGLFGEFDVLVGRVRSWLAERGIGVVEDHRSKLTFLRSCGAWGSVC
jgi:hypothetical protein